MMSNKHLITGEETAYEILALLESVPIGARAILAIDNKEYTVDRDGSYTYFLMEEGVVISSSDRTDVAAEIQCIARGA